MTHRLFGYEIYDTGRMACWSVASAIITAAFGASQAENGPTGLTKCALTLALFGSVMLMGLSAENRAVKDARAGRRVYNAFRGTYSQNDVGQEPNQDFRPKR